MGEPTARPRGVRVRTACASEAEFITAFHEVVDESTVFAPTDRMKPVKAQCAFSLELADGTPMLRGLGLITEAWPTAEASPFGRPGMKIEIDQLTTTSEVIFEKLLNARATLVAANKPRQRPNPQTHQLWGGASAPPTEEMPVPNPDIDEADAAELPRTITRELFAVAAPPDAEESQTQQAAGKYIEPKPAPARPPTPKPLPKRDSRPADAVPAPLPKPLSQPIAVAAKAPAPPPPVPVVAPTAAPVEQNFDLSGALAAARPRPWWMNGRIAGVFGAGLALGLLVSLAFRGGSDRPAPTPVAAATAPAPRVEAPAPANCQPAPAPPTEVAALEPEARVPEPPEPKARAAKVPVAAPKPASRPAPAPTKPVTVAKATPTTKPAVTTKATSKPAPTAIATTTKPATTTKTASATTTKTSKPASATTTTKTTKPAVASNKKPKKGACSSLDCI